MPHKIKYNYNLITGKSNSTKKEKMAKIAKITENKFQGC